MQVVSSAELSCRLDDGCEGPTDQPTGASQAAAPIECLGCLRSLQAAIGKVHDICAGWSDWSPGLAYAA